MSVNKAILIGFLGKDPEVKQINPEFKVANFTLATSESYTSKAGEKVESTEWHNCQASNRTAEVIEKYVHKGDQLYVEGKIKTRSWDKDGVKQYTTYIQVDLVQLFPKQKEVQPEDQYASSSPAYEDKSIKQQIADRQGSIPEDEPDGLPF